MVKSASASILFLSLVLSVSLHDVVSEGPKEVDDWLKTLTQEKPAEKMTKLHFYFHDLRRGKNVTSGVVTRSNISSPTSIGAPFGMLVSADNPLTVGPELLSKRVGYLKGLYATTSFEELDVIMAMAFVFTDKIYNGSSLSVLGLNPVRHLYREVPIVGGSGRFRLARGLVTLNTYYNDIIHGGNATPEVNIVAFHY